MSISSLARQITDAGARVWLDGELIRIRGGRALPNAIIEQLRRNKLEVIEALRRLPVCAELWRGDFSGRTRERGGPQPCASRLRQKLHGSGCGKLKPKQLKMKG